ncbi:MAG: hypothetical protein MZU91_05095 [Desulfosudis oleivorans]|nr:hypothetical protein [Desulfosudis oleivorans]
MPKLLRAMTLPATDVEMSFCSSSSCDRPSYVSRRAPAFASCSNRPWYGSMPASRVPTVSSTAVR